MDFSDRLLTSLDQALRTLTQATQARRAMPSAEGPVLTAQDRAHAGALMRVNHVGEVCAQALYQAQALTARSPALRNQMRHAAIDETDHLAWTSTRLQQLGARASLLNPLWYAGAFAIGLVVGRAGDAWSLGFVVETERQVEQHLAGHLDRLPAADSASRAVVEHMRLDEARHAEEALAAGARTMPQAIKHLMRGVARVMTATAYRI